MIDPTTKAKLCVRLRKQALNQGLITGDAVKEPRATYTFPVNTKGEYSRICWNCDNCCPAPHGGNDAWCVWHGMWVDLDKDACVQFEWDREIAEAERVD